MRLTIINFARFGGTLVLSLLVTLTVFGQQKFLTLEQARQMAIENNRQICIREDSIKIARIGLERVKTNALPSVDAGATATYIGAPLNHTLPDRNVSVNATVTQLIYAGGKVRNGVKLANLNVEVQELQSLKTRADVIVRADSAYWMVVAAKEQLTTLLKSKQYLTNALKDVNNAYAAGVKYQNDVLQVKLQFNQNELKIFKSEDALKMAGLYLSQVTGQGLKANFITPDSVTYSPVALLVDTAYDSRASYRSEIRLLEKNIEAGQIQTKLTRADMLPQVAAIGYTFYGNSSTAGATTLLGGLGTSGSAPISFNNSSSPNWLALVSVKVPVFHWGNYKKAVRQQEIRTQSKRYQLDDSREMITIDIRNHYNKLAESQKNVSVAMLSVEQSSENLRLATDRLKAGTITTTDWLQAQNLWQQSCSQAITAKVDHHINDTGFQRAIGELQ